MLVSIHSTFEQDGLSIAVVWGLGFGAAVFVLWRLLLVFGLAKDARYSFNWRFVEESIIAL